MLQYTEENEARPVIRLEDEEEDDNTRVSGQECRPTPAAGDRLCKVETVTACDAANTISGRLF